MTSTEGKIPKHVSIIMDGNGRWAAERGMTRAYGHAHGIESVRAVSEAAAEAGVEYLSLYAFSEENWQRPKDEVSALMQLMSEAMEKEVKTLMDNDIRFRVLGNRQRLNPSLRVAIDALEKKTESNSRMTLIVFLSYSGKWDILQAAKKLARLKAASPSLDLEEFSVGDFSSLLVTSGVPDPDLIIRTSGEERLSNYLLWQGAYSEFYFSKVLWPDFGKREFFAALTDYAGRERRYGKV